MGRPFKKVVFINESGQDQSELISLLDRLRLGTSTIHSVLLSEVNASFLKALNPFFCILILPDGEYDLATGVLPFRDLVEEKTVVPLFIFSKQVTKLSNVSAQILEGVKIVDTNNIDTKELSTSIRKLTHSWTRVLSPTRPTNVRRVASLVDFDDLCEKISEDLSLSKTARSTRALLYLRLVTIPDRQTNTPHQPESISIDGIDIILRCIRRGDMAAQISKSELLIVLNGVRSLTIDYAVLRIKTELAYKYCQQAGELFSYPSIGWVRMNEDNTVEKLIISAKQAERQSHLLNRDNEDIPSFHSKVIFGPEFIDQAIENNLFDIVYQPIINIQNNSMLAAESFVRLRWRGGWVAPKSIINTLAETGRLDSFHRNLITTVFSQIHHWRKYSRNLKIVLKLPWEYMHSSQVHNILFDLATTSNIFPESVIVKIEASEYLQLGSAGHIENLTLLKESGCLTLLTNVHFEHLDRGIVEEQPWDYISLDPELTDSQFFYDQYEKLIEARDKIHANQTKLIVQGIEDREMLLTLRSLKFDFGLGYHIGVPAQACDSLTRFAQASYQRQAP